MASYDPQDPDHANPPGLPTRGDGRLALVIGYGLVGRLTAERLAETGFDVTIVEMNLSTIQAQLSLDKRCTYGDARDPETLHKAGIDRAAALIITIPDDDAAVEVCKVARGLRPDLFIAARTNFVSRGLKAKAMGADAVVVEEIVTAEAMERLVTKHLCTPGDSGDESADRRAG